MMVRIIKHLLLALTYGLLGSFIVIVGLYVYQLESRPDLKVWHQAALDVEFHAGLAGEITTLEQYQQREAQLFEQLEEQVYARIDAADRRSINRFSTNSLTDPRGYPKNWNRTFVLSQNEPLAGAVLLHGLSDSPYSLRSVGQLLHERQFEVIGLRLPGHGTAPAGLATVTWHDFVTAVRIAVSSMRDRLGPDRPLYLVGYSNGAALAVHYALAVLEGEDMPAVDGLVLLSPAIEVSGVAAYAIWQARFSRLSGLEKLAWTDIQAEFDPYKYSSFTVNAGDQIYQLTRNIAARIDRLSGPDGVAGFPRTIAFQSIVDATIKPSTLVDALFMKLAPGGHELVLFDVNRHTDAEPLLRSDPEVLTDRLLGDGQLPFTLTLVTNLNPHTDAVIARTKAAGAAAATDEDIELAWPGGLFSLSHVAVPFAPDDPVYGNDPEAGESMITLGSIFIRGERNLLQIPDNYFLRLRYNPFFGYLTTRVQGFMDL
ncbi:MAG: alpha/beta fold hydrolase [Gammaproteobacteria bacterium]|nr:alpha/beta fold hydrolase [Gammaproteobacteria bacterium]